MDQLFELTFLLNRSDLNFVFKYRKLCKRACYMSEKYLLELYDVNYLVNVKVSKFKNLISLDLSSKTSAENGGKIFFTAVRDNDIIDLVKLKKLNLRANPVITNEGIINMVELTELNLRYNGKITNDGIKNMTNLKKLNLRFNFSITNKGIMNIINLEELNLYANPFITDDGIINMINLKKLILRDNDRITNEGIKNMINLEEADLSNCPKVTNSGITHFKKLKIIKIGYGGVLCNVIECLPNCKVICY